MLSDIVEYWWKKLFSDNRQHDSIEVYQAQKMEPVTTETGCEQKNKNILSECVNNDSTEVDFSDRNGNLPDSAKYFNPEEQGLVFSEDKEKLKKCTNKKITEVVIPDGAKRSGDYALEDCSSLTSVTIPKNSKWEKNDFPNGCQIIRRKMRLIRNFRHDLGILLKFRFF